MRWGERTGRLYVGGPGHSALALSGEPTLFDPGPGATSSMTPFWHAVDLFWARTADELAAALERAGIDLRRGGYARTNRSTDGVALTLGARGEGEVDLPQIWFAREPLWPTRVFFPASGEAAVGPPGPDGWPSWLLVGDETLIEIVGIPFSAPSPPPWARPISDAHRPRTASPGDSHPIFGDLLR